MRDPFASFIFLDESRDLSRFYGGWLRNEGYRAEFFFYGGQMKKRMQDRLPHQDDLFGMTVLICVMVAITVSLLLG
jgi:hypothetical protein